MAEEEKGLRLLSAIGEEPDSLGVWEEERLVGHLPFLSTFRASRSGEKKNRVGVTAKKRFCLLRRFVGTPCRSSCVDWTLLLLCVPTTGLI